METITTFLAGIVLTISGFFGSDLTLGAQPALTVPQGGTGWSAIQGGTLIYGTGSGLRLATTSTTTASCSGSTTCDSFVVIGSSPITISSTGGSGGTTAVSTSSSETSGRVPFWTSTAGTPAQLSGGVAGFAWNDTFKRLTATYSSSTVSSATTFYGALVGNADTASALAADPANCSAGNAPLGIVASGAVEGCFDVWTEAENTSAGYVVGTRALTVAGTANQITSSAGSQNLTADRTWTLSLPNHVIFPSSFQVGSATTTHATSTNQAITGLLTFNGVTASTWAAFCTTITGGAGLCDGTDGTGSTDVMLWSNASSSPLSVLSLNANSSSSIAFLSSVRATSTDFINTNATSSITSVTTHLRSQGTTRLDNMTSAILLTGSTGLVAEYAGAGCTNQVIEDLDALGAPTCRTITSAYVDSTISTFGFPFTPATGNNATSTVIRNTTGFIANASSSLAFLDVVIGTTTNATSTQLYAGTHFYSAGTTRINVNSGLLSTGATGVIQSTTVSSPLTFSANTLACATCATFGYPYTPATSWFATSTIYLNTAGIMSNASSTFHILRNTYASSTYASFSTATTSALIVSGLGGNGTRCLQADSAGVVSANASACGTGGGGADYNKWATSTGAMLGINPLTAFFVGIGTSSPRSLLHLATSTAPQLTISDGFASYDSWNFRTVGGTFFLATSSMATNATSTLSVLTIGSDGVVNFGNRINTCIALTGSSDLCDGVDSGGVGGTSAASKWATTTGMLAISPAGALRIGVGTTSPYGVFSANGNTWPQLMLSDNNLTTDMKHWVASTTPFGKLAWGIMNDAFTSITTALTIGTSTPDYAGNSGSLVVGTTTNGAYYGLGTSSAQFWVDGRIETGDWHFNECAATGFRTAQVTTDLTGSVLSTTLGMPCPGWAFIEDTNGVLDETVLNGYSYFRLRAGATGVTNPTAGEGFGIQHTASWMNFASNTPKLSVKFRTAAVQNATTSLYMIGYGSMTGVTSDHGALPTYYVGVVSSTTEGNWIAVVKNGNQWIYKNTGIASSSVLVGESAWGQWDISVSSTTAEFVYKGTNGIATTTNKFASDGTLGTYIPTHNGLRVTPITSTGKPTIGLQQELHVGWIRLWWRDLIF
jgi:hypothetical protein